VNITHTHTHYHFHHHGETEASAAARHHEVVTTLQELRTTMSAITDKLDALRAGVERIETAEAAVAAFVAGVPALIQAAVDAAIAAGATPAELASFDELNARLTADADKITSDVMANTGGGDAGGGTPPDGGTPQPDV